MEKKAKAERRKRTSSLATAGGLANVGVIAVYQDGLFNAEALRAGQVIAAAFESVRIKAHRAAGNASVGGAQRPVGRGAEVDRQGDDHWIDPTATPGHR